MRSLHEQLWLELPPVSPRAPARLLVFLHDAGSTPERIAPMAIAWQLKFPGATAALLQAPWAGGAGALWFDPRGAQAEGSTGLRAATRHVQTRLAQLQQATGLAAPRTVLVGVGQGATLTLELARQHPAPASIVVAYAGRLSRPMREGEQVAPTVHLIHGEFDTVVPMAHSVSAYRGLQAVGADVTLDLVEDEAHEIGQGLVSLGTTRVMQTVFRGRKPAGPRTLH